MLYLSDPIYIEKNFSENGVGSYLSYSVFIRPVGLNPTLTTKPYKQIYQGHIYVTGETQRIYLNDIITPHLYDHSYIKPNISIDWNGKYTGVVKSLIDYPESNVMIKVEYNANIEPDEINVLQYYADNQLHNFPSNNIETDDNPLIINLLTLRTNILPRVPRITTATNKFWVGAKLLFTKGYFDVADSNITLHWATLNTNQPSVMRPFNDSEFHSQLAWNITGNTYKHLSQMSGSQIGVFSIPNHGLENIIEVPVAKFDDCPSDFYLIWMDRTGAYQCQPLNKRAVRKENITTTNIINSIDQTRPVLKSISNAWTLNSDWLSFEEYNAYESIFSSPYLYLYDYKNDEGYWVNCTNKSWEERNSSNTKKPFNLTINLESNQSQNIIY